MAWHGMARRVPAWSACMAGLGAVQSLPRKYTAQGREESREGSQAFLRNSPAARVCCRKGRVGHSGTCWLWGLGFNGWGGGVSMLWAAGCAASMFLTTPCIIWGILLRSGAGPHPTAVPHSPHLPATMPCIAATCHHLGCARRLTVCGTLGLRATPTTPLPRPR